MDVVFRCDSSYTIGTGHVFRCIALGQQFQKLGAQIHFISKNHDGYLDIQAPYSSRNHVIDRKAAGTQQADAQQTREYVDSLKGPVIIVVDNYALDFEWESAFFGTFPIVVIDDLYDRPHKCNVLIDNNFRSENNNPYDKLLPPETKVCSGPSYAILRDEFIKKKENNKDWTRKKFKKAFVFFGGSDATKETFKFLKALEKIENRDIEWQVVASAHNQWIDEIKTIPKSKNVALHINPSIPDLMEQCDFYFGSGGTITWERMYLGLPGIIVSVAENQEKIAKDLDKSSLQIYLGPADKVDYSKAIEQIFSLAKEEKTLQKMSADGLKLVHPISSDRLDEIIKFEDRYSTESQISIVPAVSMDAEFLFDLRNDPDVRAMSRNKNPLVFTEHLSWFETAMQTKKLRIYIGRLQNQKMGQVRINPDGVVSIAIDKKFQGQGLAQPLLSAGIKKYLEEFPETKSFKAQVLSSNKPSKKIFEKVGFVFKNELIQDEETFLCYELTI